MGRLIIGLGLLAGALVGQASAQAQAFKILDRFSGDSFIAVAAAVPEIERQGLHVGGYKIAVVELGDALIVVLTDPASPIGCRGSCGQKPGLEVVLEKATLRVMRSYAPR